MRIVLTVLALAVLPGFAAADDLRPPPAPPVHQQVGTAARETGQILRRGWDRTKVIAHRAGAALDQGWHTLEHGVRWGWNHPNAPDSGHRD